MTFTRPVRFRCARASSIRLLYSAAGMEMESSGFLLMAAGTTGTSGFFSAVDTGLAAVGSLPGSVTGGVAAGVIAPLPVAGDCVSVGRGASVVGGVDAFDSGLLFNSRAAWNSGRNL